MFELMHSEIFYYEPLILFIIYVSVRLIFFRRGLVDSHILVFSYKAIFDDPSFILFIFRDDPFWII